MGKGSEDIKGHEHGGARHGHSHSAGSDEFLAQVRALKAAEAAAAARVEDARNEAARAEAAAREQEVEMVSKARQKAVEAKNEIIAKKREQSEKDVGAVLGAARKQSGALRAKRLSDQDVSDLAKGIY